MGGQVLGNALISAVGSINWGEVALDGVAGGISGFVGGNGISTKHLMNLGKQSVIRPVKALYYKGAKAAVSEAKKAATYYVKSAKHAVEPLATSLGKAGASSAAYSWGNLTIVQLLSNRGIILIWEGLERCGCLIKDYRRACI